MLSVSRLRFTAVLWVALLLCGPSSALADRAQAVQDLVSSGGLRKRQAQKVLKKVAARMAKSADNFASDSDPLRVALSRKLFGADVPGNRMKAAKVRLKLFAGPSSWALSALFVPGPGQIAACKAEYKLSAKECQALLATGGGVTLAKAKAADKGRAPAKSRPAATRSGTSRFARFDSGYRKGAGKPVPSSTRQRGAAPAASARRPAAPARAQSAGSTREAYMARRKAYLERQRARLEARKNKHAYGRRKSTAPAQTAAKSSPASKPSPTAASGAGDAMEFTPEQADQASAPAAAPAEKQQLSGDFLEGLLDDPLGNE